MRADKDDAVLEYLKEISEKLSDLIAAVEALKPSAQHLSAECQQAAEEMDARVGMKGHLVVTR